MNVDLPGIPASVTRSRTGFRPSRIALTVFIALSVVAARGAVAAPMTIYAAGSLNAALPALMSASGLPATAFAAPVYGPAGTLADKLTGGATADLFASADVAQPTRVAQKDGSALVVPFALNQMCIASRTAVGLTPSNLLDRLTSDKVRLATSTPVADPAGDYALAVFDKAGSVRSDAAGILKAKAMHLLGSPNSPPPANGQSPAASIFLDNRADALLYYCSGTAALKNEVKGLVTMPVPDALEVHPVYALTLLSNNPDAARFALFILSTKGQAILAQSGFLPLVPQQP